MNPYNEDQDKRINALYEKLHNSNLIFDNSISLDDYFKIDKEELSNFSIYLKKIQKDIDWLKRNKHTKIYSAFIKQLESVESFEIKIGDTEIYSKMRFSYVVTLMESCLCEMLKSVTMQYDEFRRNAINNINDLKTLKVSAPILLDKNPKEILDSAIMTHLSHILYHNIDKVTKVYSDVLGGAFPVIGNNINKNVSELMALRHDIVHRNGMKVNGEKIDVTPETVASCILDIRTFVLGVHNFIMQSVEKLKEKNV